MLECGQKQGPFSMGEYWIDHVYDCTGNGLVACSQYCSQRP